MFPKYAYVAQFLQPMSICDCLRDLTDHTFLHCHCSAAMLHKEHESAETHDDTTVAATDDAQIHMSVTSECITVDEC